MDARNDLGCKGDDPLLHGHGQDAYHLHTIVLHAQTLIVEDAEGVLHNGLRHARRFGEVGRAQWDECWQRGPHVPEEHLLRSLQVVRRACRSIGRQQLDHPLTDAVEHAAKHCTLRLWASDFNHGDEAHERSLCKVMLKRILTLGCLCHCVKKLAQSWPKGVRSLLSHPLRTVVDCHARCCCHLGLRVLERRLESRHCGIDMCGVDRLQQAPKQLPSAPDRRLRCNR
mmetsp:Transcript_7791/g.24454  ORF Transcript_7791/g.24454 Transcript_7791/m.24454 type:complete len:227 (-) Transcript_7791:38-718(-)